MNPNEPQQPYTQPYQQQPGYPPPGSGQPVVPPQPAQQGIMGWARRSTGNMVIALVGAVLGLCVICSCLGGALSTLSSHGTDTTNNTGGTSSSNAEPPPANTQAPKATSTPKPVPQPKQVISVTGNGDKKTEDFTVSGKSQSLAWSCDPSSFYGGSYNLMVDVYDSTSKQEVDFGTVNTICQAGNASDTTTLRLNPGTYYLDITSEAAWTITVTDRP